MANELLFTIGGSSISIVSLLTWVWKLSQKVEEVRTLKEEYNELKADYKQLDAKVDIMQSSFIMEARKLSETMIKTNTTLDGIRDFLKQVNEDTKRNSNEINDLKTKIAIISEGN